MNVRKSQPCYRPTKRFKTATEGCHPVELAILMEHVSKIVLHAPASSETQISKPFVFRERSVQLKFRRLGGYTIKSKRPIVILDDLIYVQVVKHSVSKVVLEHLIVGLIVYMLTFIGNTAWAHRTELTFLLSG